MFKEPKLTDKDCASICKDMDLNLYNAKAHNGDKLTMSQNGKIIDTIYSFEEDEHYKSIVKKLSGDVLIFGLGFGFSVLSACINKSVNKVIVVEKNPEVIAVFEAMNKKFKGLDKLTIINKSAFDYKELNFDHVFIDIGYHVLNKVRYTEEMNILKDRYKGSNTHYFNLIQYGR